MERQRSFSLKPTRLLVFSFTIFSSTLFLSTFTIWLIKYTPSPPNSLHNQTLLHFNTSSPSPENATANVHVGLQPLNVQSLTAFTKNFTVKIPTLVDNRLTGPHNNFSGSKSEDLGPHFDVVSSSTVNSTTMQEEYNGTSSESKVNNEQKKKVVAAGYVGKTQVPILNKIEQKTVIKECDLKNGYWVFDQSYPLYAKDSCPFIDEGFDCEGNGRLDRNYTKWRWQPKDCDIPRYYQIQSVGTSFFFCWVLQVYLYLD